MKIAALFLSLCLAGTAGAKDLDLADCPAPVKAKIADFATESTFEKVTLLTQQQPSRYEARFHGQDGRRFIVHITPDGKVQGPAKPLPKAAR